MTLVNYRGILEQIGREIANELASEFANLADENANQMQVGGGKPTRRHVTVRKGTRGGSIADQLASVGVTATGEGIGQGLLEFNPAWTYVFQVPVGGFPPPSGQECWSFTKEGETEPVHRARIYGEASGDVIVRKGFMSKAAEALFGSFPESLVAVIPHLGAVDVRDRKRSARPRRTVQQIMTEAPEAGINAIVDNMFVRRFEQLNRPGVCNISVTVS
jgi:hypothetical protein